MQINIQDAISQTVIFTIILLLAVVSSFRKDHSGEVLSISRTNQLKGLAILMVIFSHTGYFLSSDTRFLYPLSVGGGIGVNLFLFLSGFGLTASSLKNSLSLIQFYLKRLKKIFLPMWMVITILLVANYFLLNLTEPIDLIIKAYLGFFPKAHIFWALDPPLWYFTPILFYYLIFPVVFWRKYPVVSATIILLVSLILVNLDLPIEKDVLKLYKLHVLAFPMGMLFANLLTLKPNFKLPYWPVLRYGLALIMAVAFGFTAIHSGVGQDIRSEQVSSLISMLALILLIVSWPFQSGLLTLFGVYSYEIYLIQWPLSFHYDFLYKNLPASLATILYLTMYLAIALGLQKLTTKLLSLPIRSVE